MAIIYQSSRIMIREFLPSEEILFCSFFEDEDVTQYLPQLQPQEYIDLFNAAIKEYQLGSFGRWGIFDPKNSQIIGNCLLRPFIEIPGQIEIGYSLAKAYWGKGIGTEVAKALVYYGFANTDSREIVALTDIRNLGSQKVLINSGFKQLENIVRKGVELNYFVIERS
ncbi:GNAT family N-acetyltransferase [Pedobacter sp. CFBP9032]|uniref:GNAT family N-acetyltransferase n=1 Tax=Pedobacter sp. CFBP9032 TaxID=3096539 RepID=UPI002A6A8351|nr:GNAT family N-acetyltransferase [Pedobacter sp. CFBP9032]MDY0907800.1 GNAT family N-acetyltransferase [Pedobacter sp. CFBP9032]